MSDYGFCVSNPLPYISCFNTRPRRKEPTWVIHTKQHACLASLLATMMCTGKSFTRCAKDIAKIYHVGYRRLMNYARYTHLVGKVHGRYTGFGKICEFRVYAWYESHRKSWSRKVEILIDVPTPLHIECSMIRGLAMRIAEYACEEIYGSGLASAMNYHILKVGVLEGYNDVGHGKWCNGKARAPLNSQVSIQIDDERGYIYEYSPNMTGCDVVMEIEKRIE